MIGIEDIYGPGGTPIPNGAVITTKCPDTCDPVIGTDGKVYKNECYAKAAGAIAIANAQDRSICDRGINDIKEWVKKYWYIVAAFIAALVLLSRK